MLVFVVCEGFNVVLFYWLEALNCLLSHSR